MRGKEFEECPRSFLLRFWLDEHGHGRALAVVVVPEDEGLIEFTAEGSFLWPIGANPLEGTNGDPLTSEPNGTITRLTFENHDPLNTANVQFDALIDTTPSTTP